MSILVNNAGIVSGSTLLDTPDGRFSFQFEETTKTKFQTRIVKTFEVNVLAHFWTIKVLYWNHLSLWSYEMQHFGRFYQRQEDAFGVHTNHSGSFFSLFSVSNFVGFPPGHNFYKFAFSYFFAGFPPGHA